MAIHTCPRCELRFERESEVADHLVNDHRFDTDALRPHPVPAPRPGRRMVVVVGNHTLLADTVRDHVRSLLDEGGTDVHVVVPVHNEDDLEIGFWRGRVLAERLVGADVAVTVDVGVEDPVVLVEKSLHAVHVDHIVVSTLPSGLSKWLDADVAGRLRHALNVPVDVVTAEG